jgi:hypothetical protein
VRTDSPSKVDAALIQVRRVSLVPSGLSTMTTQAWQTPMPAAELRAGQAEIVMQIVDHRQLIGNVVRFRRCAVHGDGNTGHLRALP